jgi:hypothetical protein
MLRSPEPVISLTIILLIKRFPEAEILLEPVILPEKKLSPSTYSSPFITLKLIFIFLYQL